MLSYADGEASDDFSDVLHKAYNQQSERQKHQPKQPALRATTTDQQHSVDDDHEEKHIRKWLRGWTFFLRSSDWSKFRYRHFRAGLDSLSDLLWFFGDAVHGFSSEGPRVSDLKNYSVHQFLLFHQRRKVERGKWKRENGIFSAITKLTTDGSSINQSIDRTTTWSNPNLLQPLTAAFHGHLVRTLQDKNQMQNVNDEISQREVPSLSFILGTGGPVRYHSIDWLIEGKSSGNFKKFFRVCISTLRGWWNILILWQNSFLSRKIGEFYWTNYA